MKHILLIITKTISISIVIYILGHILATVASSGACEGWECGANIKCPDGYAIKHPNGQYIPCEGLEEFWSKGER